MRLTHLTFGCAVIAMMLSTAQAQLISDQRTTARPVSSTSYYEELEAVNAELANLKARFATLEEAGASGTGLLVGHSGDSGKGACNSCTDEWCNPCSGLTFDAMALWLRPQDSEPNSTASMKYDTASRFSLGYMNANGRMFRARYYEFFHDNFDGDELKQELVDLELAGRFRLGCHWAGEVMGGVRYAQYEDNDNDYNDTIGPMLGVEVRNHIWDNAALFGMFRQSYQFGRDDNSNTHGSFGVSELQLGAEYNRYMLGSNVFLRGVFEAQQWSGVEDADSEDLGLIGFGVSMGFTR